MVDFQDHANAESWRMRHKCPMFPKHTHKKGVCLVFVSVSDTLYFFFHPLYTMVANIWQVYENYC